MRREVTEGAITAIRVFDSFAGMTPAAEWSGTALLQ